MKALFRLPILLIAFLTVVPSKSQDYIPMAVEGAHWIVALDHIDTPWSVDDLWEYYAEGDTSINSEQYKKIYYRSLVITQEGPPFEPEGVYQLIGFLRDDTLERKVHAISISGTEFCPANEDFLMFDFSVNPGDTLDFCLLPEFNTHILDTAYQWSWYGFDTRYYSIIGDQAYYEGLGSSYGLFEEMFAPFKKSNPDYIVYTYFYYYCRESPCDLLISLPENDLVENYFQIYPVPSRGILNIQLNASTLKGKIKLFDVYGQEIRIIQTQEVISEYTLDLTDYPSGTYFAIYSELGIVKDRQKVIISK